MMNHRIFANSILLLGALSLSVVSGCGGGKTYGTGVTQESQLAADLGGMLALGSRNNTKNIDYSSRPKLVKAPATASLPTPAEQVSSDSAYFPTNPEELRAKKLAALGDANDVPLGADNRARDAGIGPSRDKDPRRFKHFDHEESAAEMARNSKEGKEERLARFKAGLGTGLGVKPRKYLTQPPVEYRTPAETAEVGHVGEREKNANFKKVGHQSTEARP